MHTTPRHTTRMRRHTTRGRGPQDGVVLDLGGLMSRRDGAVSPTQLSPDLGASHDITGYRIRTPTPMLVCRNMMEHVKMILGFTLWTSTIASMKTKGWCIPYTMCIANAIDEQESQRSLLAEFGHFRVSWVPPRSAFAKSTGAQGEQHKEREREMEKTRNVESFES